MEIKKERNRNWLLVLYEEDETHQKAIEKIKTTYDYAMILHDKDTDENGEIKKPHYHVVLKFNNPKWNTALADELGITLNYIEEPRSFKKSLEYLIHYNEPEKYQYSIDEVQGQMKDMLLKFIQNDGKDENQKSSELFDYIHNYEGILEIGTFGRYCQSVGMWDVFRRATLIFLKYIEEHNNKVYQREKALIDYNDVWSKEIYQIDIDEFLDNKKLT